MSGDGNKSQEFFVRFGKQKKQGKKELKPTGIF
jgi:hypothetical protein